MREDGLDLPDTTRPRRCAVVLPVYNEARCVLPVLERVKAAAARATGCRVDVVCVDDGSTDGSGALLDGVAGVTVIRHASNQGYGASLSDAIDAVEHEWVLILDADGTYPPEEIPRFLEAAEGHVMVVGARRGPGVVRSPLRNVARWILRLMVRFLTGARVDDLNSGMRLFRRELHAEFRHLLPRGFSFTTTITVASLYRAYPVRYLDIEYGPRVGASHIRPLRDFVGFVALILRIATRFDPLRFYLPASALCALLALACARRWPSPGALWALPALLLLAAGALARLRVDARRRA